MSFTKVCSVGDIWEGEMEPFTVDGHDILLVGVEGGEIKPSKVLHVISETPAWSARPDDKYTPAARVSGEITPEYLGVGYIIGPKIAGVLVAGGVLAWLSMLTWSRAADRRRRRKPEVDIASVHPKHGVDAYTSCEEKPDTQDMEAFVDGHRVRVALGQIRADQRRLILMAFFEGASHGDIAERTGMPLGTVKSHIRRGMESLRAQLEGATGHGR